MSKIKNLTSTARLDYVSYDEFYDGISQDWELRAKRLQARRWRKLKYQLI